MTKTTLSRVLQGGCAAAVIALSPMASADVTLSGQVNRAIVHADDGVDTGTHFVDNDVSSTRFRIKGTHKLDDTLTFGAQIETELRSNSSVTYSIDQTKPEKDFEGMRERKLELFIKSKNAGTLWLGQGDMASNGSSEQDVSGTNVINHAEFDKLGRNLQFRSTQAGPDGTHAQVSKVGDVFNDMDGMSRRDRVRYDTPSFGGVKFSLSATEGDAWDVAATYKGKFAGSKVAAAIAYADGNDRFDWDNQVSGSFSFMHASGFNLTFAAARQGPDDNEEEDSVREDLEDVRDFFSSDDDPTFYYAKLGYKMKSSIGSTAFSIDYGNVQNLVLLDDEAEGYGVFLVQKIDKVSTELYLGYRQLSLDRPGVDLEDIGIVVGGARVKF